MTGIDYHRWPGPIEAAADPLVALYGAVFEDFDPAYVLDRLPGMKDPMLWIAEDAAGWVGFKLGYRRGSTLYSWLGGVHPRARGQGVASALMMRQHEAAAGEGPGLSGQARRVPPAGCRARPPRS